MRGIGSHAAWADLFLKNEQISAASLSSKEDSNWSCYIQFSLQIWSPMFRRRLRERIRPKTALQMVKGRMKVDETSAYFLSSTQESVQFWTPGSDVPSFSSKLKRRSFSFFCAASVCFSSHLKATALLLRHGGKTGRAAVSLDHTAHLTAQPAVHHNQLCSEPCSQPRTVSKLCTATFTTSCSHLVDKICRS